MFLRTTTVYLNKTNRYDSHVEERDFNMTPLEGNFYFLTNCTTPRVVNTHTHTHTSILSARTSLPGHTPVEFSIKQQRLRLFIRIYYYLYTRIIGPVCVYNNILGTYYIRWSSLQISRCT